MFEILINKERERERERRLQKLTNPDFFRWLANLECNYFQVSVLVRFADDIGVNAVSLIFIGNFLEKILNLN